MTTRTGATVLLFIATGMNSFVLADPPGPAGPGGDPTNTPAAPVGAPLDNGTWILLGLAIFYLSWKVFAWYRKRHRETIHT